MLDSNEPLNTFYSIKSESKSFVPGEELDLVIRSIIRSYQYIVMYRIDGVSIDVCSGFDKLPDDFQELRAFDEDGEFHLVRLGGKLVGRRRTDFSETGSCEVFDEEHFLWGRFGAENSVDESDRLILRSSRGTMIDLPVFAGFDGSKERVTLMIRNYLDEAQSEFQFTDSRFVSLRSREVLVDAKG